MFKVTEHVLKHFYLEMFNNVKHFKHVKHFYEEMFKCINKGQIKV